VADRDVRWLERLENYSAGATAQWTERARTHPGFPGGSGGERYQRITRCGAESRGARAANPRQRKHPL